MPSPKRRMNRPHSAPAVNPSRKSGKIPDLLKCQAELRVWKADPSRSRYQEQPRTAAHGPCSRRNQCARAPVRGDAGCRSQGVHRYVAPTPRGWREPWRSAAPKPLPWYARRPGAPRTCAISMCSSSAASPCTRAVSPRCVPAKARPLSPRCRPISTLLAAAAFTSSRSTITWHAGTPPGWGPSTGRSAWAVGVIQSAQNPMEEAYRLSGGCYLRHQQRIRLRLPARQHGVHPGGQVSTGPPLRHRR